MKFTRKGYGQLRRADGSVVSQHIVAEEAYERAATEGGGVYTYYPPRIEIDVPVVDDSNLHPVPEPEPAPAPVPTPAPAPSPAPSPAPAPAPAGRLLQKSDLRYLGAFKVPGPVGSDTFEWGGTALGLGAMGKSLYLTGHDHQQRSAEISIPEVRTSGYATASLLQSWRADDTVVAVFQVWRQGKVADQPARSPVGSWSKQIIHNQSNHTLNIKTVNEG